MNQIYACRKGREIPFTDTTSISTVPTAKRSGGRTVFSKFLSGILLLCVVFTGLETIAQNARGIKVIHPQGDVGTSQSRLTNQVTSRPRVSTVDPNRNLTPIMKDGKIAGHVGSVPFPVETRANYFRASANLGMEALQSFSNLNPICPVDGPNGLPALYPSTIAVPAMPGLITQVRVTLNNISHTFPDDLDIILVGPQGVAFRSTLMSDVGGNVDLVNITYIFDQITGVAMDDANFNPAGTYLPTNFDNPDNYPPTGPGSATHPVGLNIFNGQSEIGNWNLFVVDDAAGDLGCLNGGWTLEITTDPNCPSGPVHNINTGMNFCTIQGAIDDPNTLDGHQINIDNGTYNENIVINKDLTLNGQSQAGVIIRPVGHGPGTSCSGITFEAGSITMMTVEDDGVTIQNLTLNGDGAAGGTVNARNGIVTNFNVDDYTNLTVNNVTVTNVFSRGIYTSFAAVTGNTFTFTNNTVSNITGDLCRGEAILNIGNTGTVTGNTISNVLQGISTNGSEGTTISGNNVTVNANGTGIQSLQNAFIGAGTADNINNNIVSGGANGIVAGFANKNVVINNNSISGYSDYGVAIISQLAAIAYTVTNNDINGMGAATTTGILISTVGSVFPGGFDTDVVANVNNNLVTNNTTDGITLETSPGETNTTTGHFNSFGLTNANGASSVSTGGAGGILVADLTCNWWGSTDLATVDSRVDDGAGVVGPIVFVPYLTSGTDTAPGTRGFQTAEVCAAPCSNITTTISSPAEVCQNVPANVTMTANGGVAPYVFNYTLNGVPQTPAVSNGAGPGPGTALVPIPTGTVGTYTYQLTSVTGANGCTNAPNPPPTSTTTTVRPLPSGTIFNSGGQTICQGTSGTVNVFLGGTPRFDGCFNITVINGAGTPSTYCWTSMQVGGPQGVTVPAANLTNTSSSPTTYRISWGTLTDNNPGGPSCVAPAGNLTGFEDIVVMPLPIIVVNAPANVCPGSQITWTVSQAPGNTVPTTMNYTVTASPAQPGFPVVVNNAPLGNVTVTTAACPTGQNTTYTITATPVATAAPNCQGAPVSDAVLATDTNVPVFTWPAGMQNPTLDRCDAAGIAAARAAVPTVNSGGCPTPGVLTPSEGAESFGPTCGYTTGAGYQTGETGVIQTIFTATDLCGNVQTSTQTITIVDNTVPTWTSPAGSLNQTVNYCDPAAMTAAQAMTPTFSDQCPWPAPHAGITPVKTAGVFSPNAGCPTSGTIVNTWTVTDPCGNVSAVFTQTITVQDNTGPVFTPSPVPAQTLNVGAPAGGNCSAPLPNYVQTLPITARDCVTPGAGLPASPTISFANGNYNQAGGPNTIFQTPIPGTVVFGPAGTIIPITVTATDACGNVSMTSFNVNIVDQTPPNIVCRDLQSGTAGTSSSQLILGSNGQVTATVQQNANAVSNINAGTTDACGGPIFYSFTPMTFNGVGNTPINHNPTRIYTCADIIDGNQFTDVSTTMWVMDQYGNQTSCTRLVRVRDTQAPSVLGTCPGTQTLARDAGCAATLPNYITLLGIQAQDNCPILSVVQSPAPGTIFGAGGNQNITVTITATDVHTNSAIICTFTVQLRDVTPPTFGGTCPVNQTLGSDPGSCSTTAFWTVPTPTDNCSPINLQGPITMTAVATGPNTNPNLSGAGYTTPGNAVSATFFTGTTTVTYTATDAAGNSTTCVFTITVIDNVNPVITFCPGNQTFNVTPSSGCTFTNSGTGLDITGTDNCLLGLNPFTYSGSGATNFAGATTLNGRVFNRGVTTVVATVTDFSGNQTTCTFTVTVIDNINPALTCPANITQPANQAGPNCRAVLTAAQTAATVSDNCGVVLFEWDVFPGTSTTPVASGTSPVIGGMAGLPNNYVFHLGTTNVQYRITDAQGNIVTCTFVVTVVNNVTGTISGTTTVPQNAATTSTIVFTGSGSGAPAGTQQYRFFYSLNTNGGGFVAQAPVTTAVGSNVTTVPQSNANLGTFVYRLDQVQDLTTGCMSPVLNLTATVTVTAGVIDLTTAVDLSSSQVNPGNFIEYIIVVRNIGQLPTNGTLMTVNVTPFTGGLSGLTQSQVAGAVTVNGTPYTPTAGWTYNAATGDLTSTNVIPAGGNNVIRLRITRAAAPNQGAPGTVNSTVTIMGGSGGEQAPQGNNNSQNTAITKPN